MSALNELVAKRTGKLLRKLASDFEGEILNAVAAMKRLFASEGLSFNDIATVVENADGEIEQLKYSDSDAGAIYARGIEEGRKQNAGSVFSPQFFDADGTPRWMEIAKFCQNNPAVTKLNQREQGFIEEQISRLQYRPPT